MAVLTPERIMSPDSFIAASRLSTVTTELRMTSSSSSLQSHLHAPTADDDGGRELAVGKN